MDYKRLSKDKKPFKKITRSPNREKFQTNRVVTVKTMVLWRLTRNKYSQSRLNRYQEKKGKKKTLK